MVTVETGGNSISSTRQLVPVIGIASIADAGRNDRRTGNTGTAGAIDECLRKGYFVGLTFGQI